MLVPPDEMEGFLARFMEASKAEIELEQRKTRFEERQPEMIQLANLHSHASFAINTTEFIQLRRFQPEVILRSNPPVGGEGIPSWT